MVGWPGSVLEALLCFAGGLFDWSKHSLPEDIFIKSGSTVLLETVSHEQFTFIRAEKMSPLLERLLNDGLIIVYNQVRETEPVWFLRGNSTKRPAKKSGAIENCLFQQYRR